MWVHRITVLSGSWVGQDPNLEAWGTLQAAFREGGIGHVGQHYMVSRPWQLGYFIRFAQAVRTHEARLSDRHATEALADRLLLETPHAVHEARHIVLHLLYPEHYERTTSKAHRKAIIEAFGGPKEGESEDETLARIRAELSAKYEGDFDFYKKNVRERWDPPATGNEDEDKALRVWVECTLVKGRLDRVEGPYAVGKALWSPQKSKAGADIYRFMREVQPGDLVLHLTDNTAITRVSRVASACEDFEGVADTEWGIQPSYLVRLKKTRELDPPLHRERIFRDENLGRLREIRDAAPYPVFYQKNGDLRQGAYLTRAPQDLVALLNEEYESLAGRRLVEDALAGDGNKPRQDFSKDWLLHETLWTEPALDELIEVLRSASPQVVLAGPPGTGKTWVAERVAEYLVGGDRSRYRTVQFHPSFGYEEFIEGLRPVSTGNGIKFTVVHGVVTKIVEDMDDEYVLVIDEMNRANLPRVFGELMYLFEYRDQKISLQYTENFSLPKGLKFIGTMNTADRSIRSIDLALRRRFDVFECDPDPEILAHFYADADRVNEVEDLIDGMVALNERLRAGLDRHHTIGHTFFMRERMTPEQLRAVWKRKLRPLIEEYFFDQPDVWKGYNLAEFWPSLGAD